MLPVLLLNVLRTFVYLRAHFLRTVLESLQQASIQERLRTSSLGLGAVLLFIFNSLFTLDAETEPYLEIMQQCGRRQRDPESDEWLIVGRKNGLFFIAEIVQDEFVSRVSQPLLEDSIKEVYKCAHGHAELVQNSGIYMATGSKVNPLHTKNKQAYTTRASDLCVGPAPPERRMHAAELGLQIPPPSQPPPNPIQGVAAEDVGLGRAESPTAPEDLQPKVNEIWQTLPRARAPDAARPPPPVGAPAAPSRPPAPPLYARRLCACCTLAHAHAARTHLLSARLFTPRPFTCPTPTWARRVTARASATRALVAACAPAHCAPTLIVLARHPRVRAPIHALTPAACPRAHLPTMRPAACCAPADRSAVHLRAPTRAQPALRPRVVLEVHQCLPLRPWPAAQFDLPLSD
jgi:hypothetical protein